jgi:hypothetical protein
VNDMHLLARGSDCVSLGSARFSRYIIGL